MSSSLSRLWPYVKRYRGQIAAGIVCLIAVDVIQLYFPMFIAQAVDALRKSDAASMRRAIFTMVALAALIVGIRYVWRLLLLGASRKIEVDLRDDYFAKLLRLPQTTIDHSRSGDLLSISTNDIAVIRQFLGFGIMSLCDSAVLILFSVCLMLTLSVPLTLLVAIPLPLVTFVMVQTGVKLHDAHEENQNCYGDLSARLQEDIAGVRVVRSYGQEENRRRQFSEHAKLYWQKNMRVIGIQGMFNPLLKFLAASAGVLVLWFGGREVIRGNLTLGQYVAFSGYVAMLSWPLMALGWIINLVQRARASMERINRVMDADSEHTEATSAERSFQTLEIRGLTQIIHDDPDGRDSGSFDFENIRLTIRKGEWVGLVGKTAAGKSALVGRILRIYDPPASAIFFDGVDVTQIDRQILRGRISYVPQEGFLFSQTLLSNFKLGSRAAADDRVSDIVEAVQMKDEIAEFADGLKTRVGERGVTLSGGQRQRVALGRALLKDADFYIFDDPFSAVDLKTEQRIFEQLRRRLSGRGVLLISHRFRTLSQMDRIVVLDAGRVVETGSHDELMRHGGAYARLASAQAAEDALEVEMGAAAGALDRR